MSGFKVSDLLTAGPLLGERRKDCTVMVLYEDLAARELAAKVRDTLLGRFKGDIGFRFTWWRFDFLADPKIAREAAANAVSADLILVCFHQLEDVSSTVKAWFESWLSKRQAEDGALAVMRTPRAAGEPIRHRDTYLRLAARRANLDYLPPSASPSASQDIDKLQEDVIPSTATGLEESLHHRYHSSGWGSSRWGLNE